MSDQISLSSTTTGSHPQPSHLPSSTRPKPSKSLHLFPAIDTPPTTPTPNKHPPLFFPQQLSLATQHPFLRLAGQGRLPKQTLSRWLSQDRLYAQSYLGFIGSLIARVDLPYVNITDQSTSLRWRVVQCLTSALQNIHTELKFFTDAANKYGLDLELSSRQDGFFTAELATKQYIDLFRAFWTDPSMSLLEGMVVLWATEMVYLSAWRYAKSFANGSQAQKPDDRDRKSKAFSDGVMSELEGSEVNTALTATTAESAGNSNVNQNQSHATDLDGGALRDAFIPNWTSSEFEGFVTEIAELTDLLAEREDAVNRRLDVYKAVWRHILDVERRFWPDVEGSA